MMKIKRVSFCVHRIIYVHHRSFYKLFCSTKVFQQFYKKLATTAHFSKNTSSFNFYFFFFFFIIFFYFFFFRFCFDEKKNKKIKK
jgi:hypothetical protein